MSKQLFRAVVLGVTLGLTGCADRQPEEEQSGANAPPAKENPADPFSTRLLQIAGEYEAYGRVDKELRWGVMACLPLVQGSTVDLPKPDRSQVRISASADSTTHGRKLYYMFAKQVWDSPSRNYTGGSYIGYSGKTSPVGQVIVKQSWFPEESVVKPTPAAEEQSQSAWPATPIFLHDVVHREGKAYRAARQGELFVMFKLDPSTPGTDDGWVYGNVSADGRRVLSVGRLESCMNCHQKAPHDRLFGLPEEKSHSVEPRVVAWPQDWSRHLGKTVTVEGRAVEAKMGPCLLGNDDLIWIDNLPSWPEGFYSGGEKGKRLRVTGVVIKRDDMPVFLKGGIVQQGIPVASEKELQTAKWRFLLRDAKWTVLE